MFDWLRRREAAAARVDADVAALLGRGGDPYREARLRERAAADEGEARHWSRVAMKIARSTGRDVGLDTGTRMAMGATGEPSSDPDEAPTTVVRVALRSLGPGQQPFALQFLGSGGDGLRVVEEREIRTPDAGTAIELMARETWPARATYARLVDVDGRVLAEYGRR